MFLFYVRHADPIYCPDSITQYGQKQAKALSSMFFEFGLDKIFCSSSQRAIMTAEPTAEKLGLNIELLDFANEKYAFEFFTKRRENNESVWCFSDKETLEKFQSTEIISSGFKWYKNDSFKNEKFGRGIEFVRQVTIDLMDSLGYKYDFVNRTYKAINPRYKRVAIFAHGGFGMAFMSCLLERPYPLFVTRFTQLSTTGVSIFKIEDEGSNLVPKFYQYNNDFHLYKKGLTGLFNG